MPSTTNWNLPLYGPGDTAALDTLLNGQSNALDTALNGAITSFIGTDATRTALASPKLREGARFRTTDTDRDWFYDGSSWLSADPGMYLIRPTSVVNGTVAADGSIAPAAASSISLNGIFSSRFKRYRINYSWTASAANFHFIRYRNAGTDDASAAYASQFSYSTGTTMAAINNGSATSFSNLGPGTTSTQHWGYVEFINPAHSGTNMTKFACGQMNAILSQQVVNWSGAIIGKETSTYDGITIFLSAGTFSTSGGILQVYGYN
jgi:hypothetical protein